MSKPPTRERIVRQALVLFAQRGYDAVGVVEIAEAVGIKAPSLYKHFKSKQDIFDAILMAMKDRYDRSMSRLQVGGRDGQKDAGQFEQMTQEQLLQMGKSLFSFLLHDETTRCFRRMLNIERHHNSELAALYTRQYADDPLAYQSLLFALLTEAGIMRQCDAGMMALHFYAPIYLLLSICDCHPEREAEALKMLEQHIRQFNKLYRTGEGNDGW